MNKQSPARSLKNCSLLTYILVVYLVVLSIILLSFLFLWSSDARQLAVEIQQATEQEISSPFLDEHVDLLQLENGILELDEWRQIRLQFEELLEPLESGQDFRLEDEARLDKLLEF